MDTLSIALVCAAVAAAGWFAAERGRGGPFDDIVGSAVVMAAFAGCILITLGITSGAILVGAVAAAVFVAIGARLRRAFAH